VDVFTKPLDEPKFLWFRRQNDALRLKAFEALEIPEQTPVQGLRLLRH